MLNGYLPLFMLVNTDESTLIMADSYKNVAVLKREEGIGHSRDPIVRWP